ncbi:hypothetical protein ACHAXA_009895 [Cyclostephanos tholiformis]|uniref:Uncharacterized protein n=1 Tax=Cyclostephanos tholiformis TaxID=382380 RepID=A0ABD3RW70_9STRA
MANLGVGIYHAKPLSTKVDIDDTIIGTTADNHRTPYHNMMYRTPYHIFRSNHTKTTMTTTEAWADSHRIINNDEKEKDEESDDEVEEVIEEDIGGCNNSSRIEGDVDGDDYVDDDKENVVPDTSTSGLLSPNSIEIRKAARMLLMGKPSKRRVDDRARQRRPRTQHHSPSKNDAQRQKVTTSSRVALQPLSSNVNRSASSSSSSSSSSGVSDNGGNIEKRSNEKKYDEVNRFTKIQMDALNIREELAMDLGEIRDAAKNIASILVSPINRAVEAGGGAIDGAFDALTTGVDALSNGAWSVIGQLWDDIAFEGERREV